MKTKGGIIVKLYRDGYFDDRVFWNLLGSRFKKSEIEEIEYHRHKIVEGLK